MEIRDSRLYREQGYGKFEDYCRERWGWSKTHANRQIQAAEVVGNLTPIGVIPANEAQARELAAAPPEVQREWKPKPSWTPKTVFVHGGHLGTATHAASGPKCCIHP